MAKIHGTPSYYNNMLSSCPLALKNIHLELSLQALYKTIFHFLMKES